MSYTRADPGFSRKEGLVQGYGTCLGGPISRSGGRGSGVARTQSWCLKRISTKSSRPEIWINIAFKTPWKSCSWTWTFITGLKSCARTSMRCHTLASFAIICMCRATLANCEEGGAGAEAHPPGSALVIASLWLAHSYRPTITLLLSLTFPPEEVGS